MRDNLPGIHVYGANLLLKEIGALQNLKTLALNYVLRENLEIVAGNDFFEKFTDVYKGLQWVFKVFQWGPYSPLTRIIPLSVNPYSPLT